MLWTNGEAESGVEVMTDPTMEPEVAMLDNAEGEAEPEADNQRPAHPWPDLAETGPIVVLNARNADEEEDEEDEDEDDADFFGDDDEEEDDDLDDDLEDEDLEDEEFEDEEEEEKEEEDDEP